MGQVHSLEQRGKDHGDLKEVEYTKIELGQELKKEKGLAVIDSIIEAKITFNNTQGETSFKITLTPQYEEEAIIGRAFSMGLISSIDDIIEIKREKTNNALKFFLKINKNEKKIEKIESKIKLKPELILECMKKLVEETEKWHLTGGVHSAALFDDAGNLLAYVDDIGKANAVDKLLGIGIKNKLDFSRCLIVSTGRQIGAMIEKTVRAGIPFIISRGAPIYSSIEVAKKFNITLVCFAKGKRMNVYAGEERIA